MGRWSRALLLAAVLPLSIGCGSAVLRPSSTAELEALASERGVSETLVPFAVDQEMVEWVGASVPDSGEVRRRLTTLAEALLSPDGLGVEYRRYPTTVARTVFDEGQANCLSFTMLYVGLARQVGLPVYFLSVQDLVEFTREDDLVVISDHIAVGHGPSHDLTIIDFAATEGTSYRQIRPISDVTAMALFYSNRGAEYLREGQSHEAARWLEDAVRLDPELAPAWVNLGVARRRSGNLDGAETAYRRALEVEPEMSSAYHNLAALLRLRGREEEAIALLRITDRSDNRNPFSYLALGDLSLEFGRYEEAERFYRRASRLDQEEAEPLAALGLVQLETGRVAEARRSLRKARRLDPEGGRVVLLEARLRAGERPDAY